MVGCFFGNGYPLPLSPTPAPSSSSSPLPPPPFLFLKTDSDEGPEIPSDFVAVRTRTCTHARRRAHILRVFCPSLCLMQKLAEFPFLFYFCSLFPHLLFFFFFPPSSSPAYSCSLRRSRQRRRRSEKCCRTNSCTWMRCRWPTCTNRATCTGKI